MDGPNTRGSDKTSKKNKTADEARYAALSRKGRQRVLHVGFRALDAIQEVPLDTVVNDDRQQLENMQKIVNTVLQLNQESRTKELEMENVRLKALYESKCTECEKYQAKEGGYNKITGYVGEQIVMDIIEKLYPRSNVRDISEDKKHRGDLILETIDGNVVYEVKNRATVYSSHIDEFREHSKEIMSSNPKTFGCIFVSLRSTIPNMGTFHVEETTDGLLVYIGKSAREPDNVIECRLAVVTEWVLKHGNQRMCDEHELQKEINALIRQAHMQMSHWDGVRREITTMERGVNGLKEALCKMEKVWVDWIRQAIRSTKILIEN